MAQPIEKTEGDSLVETEAEHNEVNLFYFDTYPKRYYATKFIFEYRGKRYNTAREFDYGPFGIGIFVKLIRQYFAKRTSESSIVNFEGVPVSSLDDLQNISIVFDFVFKNDKIDFHYVIRNTDTDAVLAEATDDAELDNYYTNPISPADCNQCEDSDYDFTEADFDDDYEYDMMAIAKGCIM